jgi:hypothetical protein
MCNFVFLGVQNFSGFLKFTKLCCDGDVLVQSILWSNLVTFLDSERTGNYSTHLGLQTWCFGNGGDDKWFL